jgi:uncharacterized protein YjbJ (UPF0337 family)
MNPQREIMLLQQKRNSRAKCAYAPAIPGPNRILPTVIRLPEKTRPREVRRPNQHFMNSSTKDKVKGTAKEAVGKIKEETGRAIGNPNLRDRGTAEKVAGQVERKVGDVKKVFGK